MNTSFEARTRLPSDFEAELSALFVDRASFGQAIREQHGASESRYPMLLPGAVVFPHSTEEVVALVKLCCTHDVPVIPFGTGTCMEGQPPLQGGVSVDMSRMDAILSVNVADGDCTVQAGVGRQALNQHLRDCALFFPIDPGADATIGGMASTRASGTNAVRYGTMRSCRCASSRRTAVTSAPLGARASPQPAMILPVCSSAPKARWASSPK